MKIAVYEIWNFLEILETQERGWRYSLQAGSLLLEDVSTQTMMEIKEDTTYDTELLPSLFTFREILWQPDVFSEDSVGMSSLRILKSFCEERSRELEEKNEEVSKVYTRLIAGIGKCAEKAMKRLEEDRKGVKRILSDFRIEALPIIKFFIYHPKNRKDYFMDAIHRLNYAVKIMLTEFYGRYTLLEDPYWVIRVAPPSDQKAKVNSKQE